MRARDPAEPPHDDLSGSLSESISEVSGNIQTAGDLLAGITQDISRLVRLEIELAKRELVELARPKLFAAGLGAVGLVLSLFIVPFALLTLFEAFDVFMPRWVAALVVTLLISGGCAILFLFARKKLEGTFTPERTVKSLKITMRSLKETIRWARRPTR